MFTLKKDLANVLSVLVFCPHDNTYLLLLREDRGDYWIPSTKMNEKLSWKDNLQMFKKKLFDYEVYNEKLIKIYKIWTIEKDFFHLIFLVTLPKEVKTNCKSNTSLGKVKWLTNFQIGKLKLKLRGLEILEALQNYSLKPLSSEKLFTEITSLGTLTEVREDDIILHSNNCFNQIYCHLLQSAKILIEEQYNLYENYFLNTYPCIYMNPVSFKNSISQFYTGGNVPELFRAADVFQRGFLTFQDYLYLIAVMMPFTPHYGDLAEIRCQYIFRFYVDNLSGKMNYKQFQKMILDIQYEKNSEIPQAKMEKKVEHIAKLINFRSNSLMTFDQFFSFILESKISDTSLLLRIEPTGCEKILPVAKEESFLKDFLTTKISFSSISGGVQDDGDEGYKVAVKTTFLKPGDSSLQLKELKLLAESMTSSVTEDLKILPSIKIDHFELEGKVQELLLALKYFGTKIPQGVTTCGDVEYEGKDIYSWGAAYLEKLGITLIIICEHLKEFVGKEPRLLKMEPPVYIMGDIHGNYHDLMCFEKAIWPNSMGLAPVKFLFLGDYVDRGIHSLEVIMYLFANKILNPNKLFLVRGNHEIRDIQKIFTFQRECIYKLGLRLGTSVWKAINDVFDMLPLAAVVDNKIFCCHGGIPPPWLCPVISVINTIPCPLLHCERQSPLAWNLMWNDPFKSSERNSVNEYELFTNEGFIPNVRRGAGNVFTNEALEKFLMTNNLSHVVRAHEVKKVGFQVHQKGKLLTVFSSSGYCGGRNYAATVLVADKILRAFMVETGIN